MDHHCAGEERLHRALRVAKVGSWEWDVVADSLEWTSELYRMFGVDAETFEASYAGYLGLVHPEDKARVEAVVNEAFVTGEPFEFSHKILRPDGEVRIVHSFGEVHKDALGNTIRMVGTGQDVTELRASEARLRESGERAQLATQQKSQFLAHMSHEIRTPLNGVVGITELLADSPLTTTQREHVDALVGAANSLLRLLNDILDVSKIEAGKVTLEAVDASLPALVNETVALFRVAARAKGLELCAEVDSSAAEWVSLDPARVKQILGNLVGNAIKFTERGAVKVAATRQGGRLVFTVADTGIGIAAEDRERLMSPFEQGDASTSRRFGGTGLGLTICRELAALMDGRIWFDSAVGEGTTFTVELPYVAGRAPAQACTTQPASVLPAPGGGGRVLLAEDTPVNQLVARAMLENLGWSVEIVENGQDAVDALSHDSFDVVILDCQLPVLDGYAAARAIRGLANGKKNVPILAMTAGALPEERQRCLDAGMDEYLPKPISRAALHDAMERVLALRA